MINWTEFPEKVIKLGKLLVNNEDFLIDRVLDYAKQLGYTKYTSTLREAWRISIQGLTVYFLLALKQSETPPETLPDENFKDDPLSAFGVLEAQKHRTRGITLEMFLSLMKYYRQSYQDLVRETGFDQYYEAYCRYYVDAYFNRVELGFISEWTSLTQKEQIIELQKTNRVMTNEKNKYLTIFESVPNPVFFLNQNKELKNLNHTASLFFHNSKVPGSMYYSNKKIEIDLSWLNPEINDITSEKGSLIFEKIIPTNFGERHFQIRLNSMLDISDKFLGTIVILNDITEIKRMEKQLINLENLRKQFVATVSHELRTPITGINLTIKNLQDYSDHLTKEQKESMFDMIASSASVLTEMVEDLLIASRIERGKLQLEWEDYNLHNVLVNIVNQMKPRYMKKEVIIEQTISPTIQLYGDKKRIGQIFRIFIDNALKYSSDPTIIKLSVINKYQGEYNPNGKQGVLIEITDNGIGIPEKDIPNLFNRFYRASNVTGVSGTGLGLSIAQDLVEKHHGKIYVKSKIGEGTSFSVFLPYIEKLTAE